MEELFRIAKKFGSAYVTMTLEDGELIYSANITFEGGFIYSRGKHSAYDALVECLNKVKLVVNRDNNMPVEDNNMPVEDNNMPVEDNNMHVEDNVGVL